MANIIGCDVLPLPISYLTLPLRVRASRKSIWNLVLEKMGNKLAHWKGNYLSFRGKLILLKSEPASMPTYFFSISSPSFNLIQDGEVTIEVLVGRQPREEEDPLGELGHYL